MSEPLEHHLDHKVELMKREIDALQIAVTGSRTPWYKNVSSILSVVALLFSFGTTFVSYSRTAAQDRQAMRQELRNLLQRMAALPKENVEITKKYADDPAARAVVSGFINQENSLLARQAAEIARRLPEDTVSGTEYYAVALALQQSYDLAGAAEFLQYSIAATEDFNTEIAARRMAANLHFIQGRLEEGRADYQRALDIFSKYPGYDPFTKISTQVWTELTWAISEAGTGSANLAEQHLAKAENLVNGLPGSPGVEMLRAQVLQAKGQFAYGLPAAAPPVDAQFGIAPPPPAN